MAITIRNIYRGHERVEGIVRVDSAGVPTVVPTVYRSVYKVFGEEAGSPTITLTPGTLSWVSIDSAWYGAISNNAGIGDIRGTNVRVSLNNEAYFPIEDTSAPFKIYGVVRIQADTFTHIGMDGFEAGDVRFDNFDTVTAGVHWQRNITLAKPIETVHFVEDFIMASGADSFQGFNSLTTITIDNELVFNYSSIDSIFGFLPLLSEIIGTIHVIGSTLTAMFVYNPELTRIGKINTAGSNILNTDNMFESCDKLVCFGSDSFDLGVGRSTADMFADTPLLAHPTAFERGNMLNNGTASHYVYTCP